MTKDQVFQNAASLPKDQRIDLVLDLWDTIDMDDAPLTDLQKQELDRRLAEGPGDADAGEDWEVLKAKLLQGYSSSRSRIHMWPVSRNDVREIVDYYDQQQPRLGRRFLLRWLRPSHLSLIVRHHFRKYMPASGGLG